MRRRWIGIGAAAALLAGVGAASLPVSCTTVGHAATLVVILAEPDPSVALELCISRGCAPRDVDEPLTVDDVRDGAWLAGSGDGEEGWVLSGTPETVVGYRLVADDGIVLAAGELEPDWVRVGGSERCGGPVEATLVLG